MRHVLQVILFLLLFLYMDEKLFNTQQKTSQQGPLKRLKILTGKLKRHCLFVWQCNKKMVKLIFSRDAWKVLKVSIFLKVHFGWESLVEQRSR